MTSHLDAARCGDILVAVENMDIVKRGNVKFQRGIHYSLIRSPELFDMPEDELLDKAGEVGLTFGMLDRKLKLALWTEYSKAFQLDTEMNMYKVVRGTCSQNFLEYDYLRNPYKAAWILIPPKNYEETLDIILLRGLERIEEIIDIDMNKRNKKGERVGIDPKLADVVLRAYKMVEDRVKGGTISRQATMQYRADKNEIKNITPENVNMELIEKEIKALEAETGELIGSGDTEANRDTGTTQGEENPT